MDWNQVGMWAVIIVLIGMVMLTTQNAFKQESVTFSCDYKWKSCYCRMEPNDGYGNDACKAWLSDMGQNPAMKVVE